MTRSSISTTIVNPRIVINYLSVVIFPMFSLSRSFSSYDFLCSTFWLGYTMHSHSRFYSCYLYQYLFKESHSYIYFVCVLACMCTYHNVPTRPEDSFWNFRSLLPLCGISGIKLRPSGMAASDSTHRAIWPAPSHVFVPCFTLGLCLHLC